MDAIYISCPRKLSFMIIIFIGYDGLWFMEVLLQEIFIYFLPSFPKYMIFCDLISKSSFLIISFIRKRLFCDLIFKSCFSFTKKNNRKQLDVHHFVIMKDCHLFLFTHYLSFYLVFYYAPVFMS